MRVPAILTAALCLAGPAVAADAPAGYPADYAKLIAAAEKERDLVVYGALDAASVQKLLTAFNKEFPRIAVDYKDLSAVELDSRLRAEGASGGIGGDVAWSGAMGLQMQLLHDGFAATYASPEKPHLAPPLVMQDQAYVVSYEPIVFVHNKQLLPDPPQTHDAFLQMLRDRKAELTGKVATYDFERNATSFTYAALDQTQFGRFGELGSALAAVDAQRYVATGTMLERIGSGQQILGYDVAGSAAMTRAAKDPELGVVFPQDYTGLGSTVMLITARARHPNAARLFLDFALRPEGQAALAQANLVAVRDDVTGEATITTLRARLGDRLKLIPLDGAAQLLDSTRRLAILQTWQRATR